MAGVETLNEARGKLARWAGRLNARHGRGRGPALILMTDDARDADWVEAVRALPRGSAVVVRHRDAAKREALARLLREVSAVRGVKLLVADDPALAMRVRADGVHVPEKHLVRVAALRAAHPRWLVTVSAHSAKAIAAAACDGVLVAPVFATASHPGRATLRAVRLGALAARSRTPVYALGGVDADTIKRLSALPLAGVAMIGGWVG